MWIRLSNLNLTRSSVFRTITFPTRNTIQVTGPLPGPHVALQHLAPSPFVPFSVDPFSGTNSGSLVNTTVPASLRFATGSNPSPTGGARRRVNQDPSNSPTNVSPANPPPMGQSQLSSSSPIGAALTSFMPTSYRRGVTPSVFVKCQPVLRAIRKEFMPPQVQNSGSIVINLLRGILSGAQEESKSEVERTEAQRERDKHYTSTFLDYMNSLDDYEKKVAASVILNECDPIRIRLSQFQDLSSDPTHREHMVKIIQFCKEQLPEIREYQESSAKLISLYLISYSDLKSTEDSEILNRHNKTKEVLVNSLFSDIKNSFFPLRVTSKGLKESHKDEHRKGLDFIQRMNQVPRFPSEEKNALKKEIKDTLLEFAEQQLNDAVANEPEDLKELLRQHVTDTLRALGDKLDKELFSDQLCLSPFYTSEPIDFSDLYQAQNDITMQQLDEIEKMRLKSSGVHSWWFYLGMG